MKKLRVVIIPSAASLMKMKKEIIKARRIDIDRTMHRIGKNAGNDLFKYLVRGTRGRENKIKKIFEVLNSTGYGKYKLTSVSDNTIVVRLSQSPFTRVCSQKGKPSCHWMSGFLSGLFNNPEGKWLFEKSRCKRLGYACCEFSGKLIK
jgi:predicted hydrocarbon binding protein